MINFISDNLIHFFFGGLWLLFFTLLVSIRVCHRRDCLRKGIRP